MMECMRRIGSRVHFSSLFISTGFTGLLKGHFFMCVALYLVNPVLCSQVVTAFTAYERRKKEKLSMKEKIGDRYLILDIRFSTY